MSNPAIIPSEARRGWWLEPEAALLILLVLAAYFTRAQVLPLRGEEPTRAQIAQEMVQTGDWIVPREQGEPFRIRPPVQNWAIALSCKALGNWDWWAVRFHSLVATLLTTLLIYAYSRTCLSRVGAISAGLAFATLPEMFQMGRQAETEAIITLFIGGALLLWHWGMVRAWPAGLTWSIGYGLMALGTLTKGIQAPVYFVGAVVVYLAINRQWRALFSRAHAIGIAVAVGIVLAWVIPYAHAVGWNLVPDIWFGDVIFNTSGDLAKWKIGLFFTHLISYPFIIFFGMLPWSLLLIFFLRADVRRAVGGSPARTQVVFAVVSFVVAFPSCWFPPEGPPRYIAPLYPSLCVLIGAVIDRVTDRSAGPALAGLWQIFTRIVIVLMIGTAVAVLVVAFIGPRVRTLVPFTESLPAALGYAAVFGALAAALHFAKKSGPASAPITVLTTAAFMVVLFIGWLNDTRLRRSVFAGPEIAAIRHKIPADEPLVSLNGHTATLFAYYYGLPIIQPRSPILGPDPGTDLNYFCFISHKNRIPKFDFAWKEIGRVSMDRYFRTVPDRTVVVGHRIATPTTQIVP